MKKKTVKIAKPKKLTIKKPKKEKTLKAVSEGKACAVMTADSGSIQDLILEALNKVLEVGKAQLYDAFKHYIESKMANGLPATFEEFIALFTSSFAAHGITDAELINSLDGRQKDYLTYSAKLLENGKVLLKTGAPVTTKKGATPVQSEQAAKIDPNEFSLDAPAPTKVTEAATGKNSVFAELDLL